MHNLCEQGEQEGIQIKIKAKADTKPRVAKVIVREGVCLAYNQTLAAQSASVLYILSGRH